MIYNVFGAFEGTLNLV